jgi:CBS domain-containing protein/sporulation protein YlmC with PRC-barrel domain
MPYIGELFVSELLKKSVLDNMGEPVGSLIDFILVPGDVFPRISNLVVSRKKKVSVISWEAINIFNRRIISISVREKEIAPREIQEDEILLCRDILDKQIVDIDGAKVVRVNDLKVGEFHGQLCLMAADVGLRGLLRRANLEHQGERLSRFFGYRMPKKLISWNYLQSLKPKLTRLTLSIPRHQLSELHPADIAHILSQIPQKDRAAIIDSLDVETAAETLEEMGTEEQASIIEELDAEHASDILEHMAPDEAADVLQDLPTDKAHDLLLRMEKEEAHEMEELLSHEEDTAGGLMTTEYLSLAKELTVREAIDQVRLLSPNVETVYYIYILDKNEKLEGVLSMKDLIMANPDQTLEEIMTHPVKSVHATADEGEVERMISKYRLLALPVVDEEERLLGIITMDDILYRTLNHRKRG